MCTAGNRGWTKHWFIQVSLFKDHGNSKNTLLTIKGIFHGKISSIQHFSRFPFCFLDFQIDHISRSIPDLALFDVEEFNLFHEIF